MEITNVRVRKVISDAFLFYFQIRLNNTDL